MSAKWWGPAGDRLRVEFELAPDDATRARMHELLGMAPEPAPTPSRPQPRSRAAVEDAGLAARLRLRREDLDAGARADGAGRWASIGRVALGLAVVAGLGLVALRAWAPGWLLVSLGVALLVWLAFAARSRIRGARAIPARLVPLDREPLAELGWLARAKPLEEPKDVADRPVDPLLRREWTRGIVAMALSTDVGDGPVDLDRLVATIARAELPERLPRLPHRSLSAGVQMLVDLSESMLPFRADLVDVVEQVRRVLGEDRVTVLRFAGDPWLAGPGRRRTWTAYDPPASRRPVLVVSDLGLGAVADQRAPASDWLRFARAVRAARCPLIALTPVAPVAVPAALRRAMSVIEWDGETSAASAARAVRGRA